MFLSIPLVRSETTTLAVAPEFGGGRDGKKRHWPPQSLRIKPVLDEDLAEETAARKVVVQLPGGG